MSHTVKPKVLLVDDEADNLQALERTLRAHFEVVCSPTGEEALEKLKATDFSAIVTDQKMPGMLGTDLLARAGQISPHTTRLVLTAFTETRTILDAINRAEIYRYITKPWDNAELISILQHACERSALRRENESLVFQLKLANQNLETQVAARTEELSQANQRLSEIAITDSLTKVANRRGLFQRFQEEIDRAERYVRPIAIVMVDVDHFKSFNDMEGHLCGDEALKKAAATLAANLRKTDFLGRYGGEEFLILMPETSIHHGLEIATRLRGAMEATVFRGRLKPAYLTISLGLAVYPHHGQTTKALVEAADQALYSAKQEGRNRIVVAS